MANGSRRSFLAVALLMVATVAMDHTIGSHYDVLLEGLSSHLESFFF
ncbi:MAG TPA: hypothetical protein VHA09_00640 [Nitrososphaera sp.]|nr:hypothetical protein [Nitrososphaera sp.]